MIPIPFACCGLIHRIACHYRRAVIRWQMTVEVNDRSFSRAALFAVDAQVAPSRPFQDDRGVRKRSRRLNFKTQLRCAWSCRIACIRLSGRRVEGPILGRRIFPLSLSARRRRQAGRRKEHAGILNPSRFRLHPQADFSAVLRFGLFALRTRPGWGVPVPNAPRPCRRTSRCSRMLRPPPAPCRRTRGRARVRAPSTPWGSMAVLSRRQDIRHAEDSMPVPRIASSSSSETRCDPWPPWRTRPFSGCLWAIAPERVVGETLFHMMWTTCSREECTPRAVAPSGGAERVSGTVRRLLFVGMVSIFAFFVSALVTACWRRRRSL